MSTSHEENLERIKPWGLVLKEMLELVEGGCDVSLGSMLRLCCLKHMVPYPPADVEQALLTTIVKRTMKGAPCPKDFA